MMTNHELQNENPIGTKIIDLPTRPQAAQRESASSSSDIYIDEAMAWQAPTADATQPPLHPFRMSVDTILDLTEGQVRMMAQDAVDRLAPIGTWVRTSIRERPFISLATTASASFLAGYLVRRQAGLAVGATMWFMSGLYRNYRSTSSAKPTLNPTK